MKLNKLFQKTDAFLNVHYKRLSMKHNPEKHMHPMTEHIKNNYNHNNLVGVEIGVREGDNAKNMLMLLPIKKLFLVDPYIEYPLRNQKEQDYMYSYMVKNIKKYKDRIEIIKMLSSEAIRYIPDNLDYVFDDGNHDYEFIKQDIELYYPKVKPGGIFGGHDYCFGYPGVIKAVDDFVDDNGLFLYRGEHDWWIEKPKMKGLI